MRIPRDVSGDELAKLLKRYGYEVTRQVGSHMRLTTERKVNIILLSHNTKHYD